MPVLVNKKTKLLALIFLLHETQLTMLVAIPAFHLYPEAIPWSEQQSASLTIFVSFPTQRAPCSHESVVVEQGPEVEVQIRWQAKLHPMSQALSLYTSKKVHRRCPLFLQIASAAEWFLGI